MNSIAELLQQMQNQRFYGALEIKLENGKIVLVRKTETILPQKEFDNRKNRGNEHVNTERD